MIKTVLPWKKELFTTFTSHHLRNGSSLVFACRYEYSKTPIRPSKQHCTSDVTYTPASSRGRITPLSLFENSCALLVKRWFTFWFSGNRLLDKYNVWIQCHILPWVKIKQTTFILFCVSSPLETKRSSPAALLQLLCTKTHKEQILEADTCWPRPAAGGFTVKSCRRKKMFLDETLKSFKSFLLQIQPGKWIRSSFQFSVLQLFFHLFFRNRGEQKAEDMQEQMCHVSAKRAFSKDAFYFISLDMSLNKVRE